MYTNQVNTHLFGDGLSTVKVTCTQRVSTSLSQGIKEKEIKCYWSVKHSFCFILKYCKIYKFANSVLLTFFFVIYKSYILFHVR